MRRFLLATVAAALATVLCGPLWADDAAVEGSHWVGWGAGAKKEPGKRVDITSADARLSITKRDGEKVAGELWVDRGKAAGTVEGTIKPNGAIALKITKVLRGEAKDVVGLVTIKGSLKKERITLSFVGTAGTKRAGSLVLNLYKPDEDG